MKQSGRDTREKRCNTESLAVQEVDCNINLPYYKSSAFGSQVAARNSVNLHVAFVWLSHIEIILL